MARYAGTILSQAVQLSGVPSGVTVNGYIGYLGAGASAGFALRRLSWSTEQGAGVPVSQQVTIGVYRQTVAPAGTGIAAAVPGEKLQAWSAADPTAGLFATTATAIGTTGPTINTNPLWAPANNSQSTNDLAWEFGEQLECLSGTANGLAFVILSATLPASTRVRLNCEWEA